MRKLSLMLAATIMTVLGLMTCNSVSQPNSWVLQYLKENKMEVKIEKSFVDNDSKPFETCGSEWNNFGTYCYSNLATTYQTEDRIMMSGLISKVSNSLFKVAQFVQKLFDLFAKLKKEKSLSRIKAFERIEKKLQGESMNRFIQFLKQFAARHGQQNHIGAANPCWAKMIAMREQAVCFICSGRNKQFEAASKLIISSKTCSSVVGSCKGEFALLAGIANGLKEFFTKLRDSLREGGILENTFGGKIDMTITHLTTIDSPTILRLLKEISEASTPEVVSKAEAELCQKTIAVVKSPFLGFLTPIFFRVQKDLEAIQKLAEELASRLNLGGIINKSQLAGRITIDGVNKLKKSVSLVTAGKHPTPNIPSVQSIAKLTQVAAPKAEINIGPRFKISVRLRSLTEATNFLQMSPVSFVGDVTVQVMNNQLSYSNAVISHHIQAASQFIPIKF